MANEIRLKPIAAASFTITLASLAASAARQSTIISNSSNYPQALLYIRIKSGGAAPTAGGTYEVYLIRSDGTVRDDGAGASDAAITVENAQYVGSVVVTNTANKNFYGIFDTSQLGPLGREWGIVVRNGTSQALSTTEGDHYYKYEYLVPEVQ